MPIELEIRTLRTTWEVGINLTDSDKARILQLNRLDEMRMEALQHAEIIQN